MKILISILLMMVAVVGLFFAVTRTISILNYRARKRRKYPDRVFKKGLDPLTYVLYGVGVVLVVVALVLPGGKESDKHKDPDSSLIKPGHTLSSMPLESGFYWELFTRTCPHELVTLFENNPETKDFVMNYPMKKDSSPVIDLSECVDSESVPLLMQWDLRWGYNQYAGEMMGISGCGPTCLSMVCLYLLDDPVYTPKYIAEFAEENDYSEDGNGSKWMLISEGAVELGLDITEIPLVETRIIDNLEVGNPIICVVGPGDFTTTGHFIVMTGYKDGMVTVNDPNSKTRSEQLWNLQSVMEQIENLWVCR